MSDARVEAAAKAIMNDNSFNEEEGLWEVPSIKAHYMAIARAALAGADAVAPILSPQSASEKIATELSHAVIVT